MRIGITGGTGFLGWHLRCRFEAEGHEVLVADRATLGDAEAALAFVAGCDAIVHAAAVNRANSDDEITEGNAAAAEALAVAVEADGRPIPVIVTNSTQSERDNVYGRAKQAAADRIAAAGAATGGAVVDLVLPHLFGEFGRPDYNSAVTTFAHRLATDTPAEINRDGRVELLHAQDVALAILALLDGDEFVSQRVRLDGRPISIGEVWDLLQAQHRRYVDERTVPAFADRFELQVFNTLRSQLHEAGYYPSPFTLHADQRGAFAELVRSDGLGQTSMSTSVPGITRGDHFHFDKIERFAVITGSARIRIRRLHDDEVRTYDVTGDEPVFIDMVPLCTHNITNTGDDELLTIFWAADHFDPAHPDTYVAPVMREGDQP